MNGYELRIDCIEFYAGRLRGTLFSERPTNTVVAVALKKDYVFVTEAYSAFRYLGNMSIAANPYLSGFQPSLGRFPLVGHISRNKL